MASSEVSLARIGNARMVLVKLLLVSSGASSMGDVGGEDSIVGVDGIVGRHRRQ